MVVVVDLSLADVLGQPIDMGFPDAGQFLDNVLVVQLQGEGDAGV